MPKIYQVFIGCPFSKDIRRNYDRLKRELEAESPISIVLADTVGVSSSDYLLEHITELIQDSAGCIFDATGANPNVSLEVVQGRTVCVVSCQRSPEPVFLKWRGVEAAPEGDFFVRSGPGTVKLPPESAREYIRTRFGGPHRGKPPDARSEGAV